MGSATLRFRRNLYKYRAEPLEVLSEVGALPNNEHILNAADDRRIIATERSTEQNRTATEHGIPCRTYISSKPIDYVGAVSLGVEKLGIQKRRKQRRDVTTKHAAFIQR